MARTRFKWKCIFFSYIILLNVFTKSLPISTKLFSLTTTDTVFKIEDVPVVTEAVEEFNKVYSETTVETKNVTDISTTQTMNGTRNAVPFNDVRPGQEVQQYALEITIDGNSFTGHAVLNVFMEQASREDPIMLHVEDLTITSVRVGVFTAANAVNVDYVVDDGKLEIIQSPTVIGSSYIVIIDYTGRLSNDGNGLYLGEYNGGNYLAMNLHPTHARRVFPCMDEPTEVSVMSFAFNNVEYTHLVTNSMLEENSLTHFRALQGPPHLWGMVAHNFLNINLPTANVLLFGRPRLSSQESQASVAINSFYNTLNEWTNKPYLEILLNQDGRMHIFAMPDVSKDWCALSMVGIWEPYVFMEQDHSAMQRKTGLTKIAEAMAKQWFGYVIFPKNWRYEWVVSGLATYAGYEAMRRFQGEFSSNNVYLDVNTLFVTDVIQESLLRDGYTSARELEPSENMFEEEEISDHIYGVLKYKAPALMRMLRLALGDNDFIQSASQALLNGRPLQPLDSLDFVDALNSEWQPSGDSVIDNIEEFLENWIWHNGYPLLQVNLNQRGVLITQSRFGFSNQPQVNFPVPLTFTTSLNPDFSDERTKPVVLVDASYEISMDLGEEDWVLFNIQGQGYYRVNYNAELWERITEALEDPERREVIHPLNRATLVDDALNLARADRLSYEIALPVVLTMEHETEYAVWKAFVRNMNFLRKRLVALVTEDEDLDPDIYLRMVRRTIGAVENELGFYPEINPSEPAMASLTRGLVMDHACRANYQPCIAAAIDLFYDPDSNDRVVNPNIQYDIRPAVYCTMVREGDDEVIAALYARLDIEASHYERVVILESLACSRNENFIRNYLDETIASNSVYGIEERVKIFAAVAESSFENADIAMNFMSRRTAEIRNMYGGPEKLEELIFILAENMADAGLSTEFRIWVEGQFNNLDSSQLAALRALQQVNENMAWQDRYLEFVYEWIDENDAPTLMLSLVAFSVSVIVALLNH